MTATYQVIYVRGTKILSAALIVGQLPGVKFAEDKPLNQLKVVTNLISATDLPVVANRCSRGGLRLELLKTE